MQARGRAFFLRHRLYKSHRTGEVAIRGSTRFPQLPQWHFDVLRGLEYFVDVAVEQDERLEDAIAVVRHARRADGRWPTFRLSRPYVVSDGRAGCEQVKHCAGASGPDVVGVGRLNPPGSVNPQLRYREADR